MQLCSVIYKYDNYTSEFNFDYDFWSAICKLKIASRILKKIL